MATCTTTRMRRPLSPRVARPPDFSASPLRRHVVRSAGARPNSMAAPTAISAAEASVRPSSSGRREEGHAWRHQLLEKRKRPAREHNPQHEPHPRERQALCQQLPHDPRPRRAERATHGKLLPPRRGAGKQQARQVRARDQQHDDDRCHEHGEWASGCARQLLRQRPGDGPKRTPALVVRIQPRLARADGVEVRGYAHADRRRPSSARRR